MSLSTIHAGKYNIFIGDIFDPLKQWLEEHTFSGLYLLMDENTENYCFPVLREKLPGLTQNAKLIEINSGEVHKNLNTCWYIWERLTAFGADRHALVINLSGGVLSDMGGFVAATYKRGIRFINLPTTLLSMVDASVGGKLGVDFNGYKNHIGLFANPGALFIYPGFLHTLPQREIKSGMAEVLKHGLIADEEYFGEVIGQLKEQHPDYQQMVDRSVKIKHDIVEKDPQEKGLRKVLNFGHTIGHAIESWSFNSGDRLLHGEAVALGMIVELHLSVKYAGLDQQKATAAIRILKEYYGNLSLDTAAIRAITQKMSHDKKNRDGMLLFTLLKEIGQPVYDVMVKEKDVQLTLQKTLCR